MNSKIVKDWLAEAAAAMAAAELSKPRANQRTGALAGSRRGKKRKEGRKKEGITKQRGRSEGSKSIPARS